MNRMDAYFLIREILCKHGAIPETYDAYEKLINELMSLAMETAD